MRFLRRNVSSFLVASAGVWLLAGMFGHALGSDVRPTPPKPLDIVAKLPKSLEGLRGKLEL